MKDKTETDYILSYAQNREDIIIEGFLSGVSKGFYVDIGANHPVIDSVTKLFYDNGWSGVNIEPNKNMWLLLNDQRCRDVNLNIGISDKNDILDFKQYKDKTGLSTFVDDGIIKSEEYTNERMQTKTLENVLDDIKPKNIHFLKIDVEGYEKKVLLGNNWKKYRPWLICIESKNKNEDWETILINNGYSQAFFDGLNRYYVSTECAAMALDFSYPNTILAKPIVNLEVESIINSNKIAKDSADRQIKKLNGLLTQANLQLSHIKSETEVSHRLKGSIKQLMKSIDNALMVRIENLNKPASINRFSYSKIIHSKKINSLKNEIKYYDFMRYYSKRSSKRLAYKIIKTSYRSITRKSMRAMKKIKNIVKRVS